MSYKALPLLIALAVPSCGCAIHPSPKDVMPRNTIEIVDHIKCEAHFAIIEKAAEKLEHNDLIGPEHDELVQLGMDIRYNKSIPPNLSVNNIPGKKAKDFYNRYINATIAFDFSLIALEDNSNSTNVDFARVITNGTVSVPFSASNDQMRQSTKTFLIANSFKDLIDQAGCDQNSIATNIQYPISGSIGLYDIISTFIDLNEEKGLSEKSGGPALYADALLFTTMTMGSVAPKLVLSSPTQAFHLTGAELNSSVTRKDTDSVNIGLALPKAQEKTKAASLKENAILAINRQRNILVQNSVIQFFSSH